MLPVGVLEITIIFNTESDIQIFLNGYVLLNESRVNLDGTLKWSSGRTVVVQGEKHRRSLAIRTEDTGHVSKLCVKTSLKTFVPNFVAFFVSLGIVISYIRMMSFAVTSAKREFTPTGHCFIIHFPVGGHCPLVRDSKPIRLLEIPTSPSNILHSHDVVLGHFGKTGVYAGRPFFHYPPPRRWTTSTSQR